MIRSRSHEGASGNSRRMKKPCSAMINTHNNTVHTINTDVIIKVSSAFLHVKTTVLIPDKIVIQNRSIVLVLVVLGPHLEIVREGAVIVSDPLDADAAHRLAHVRGRRGHQQRYARQLTHLRAHEERSRALPVAPVG